MDFERLWVQNTLKDVNFSGGFFSKKWVLIMKSFQSKENAKMFQRLTFLADSV